MKTINTNGINEWPKKWANCKDDIIFGKELIKLMKPFVNSLQQSSLSPKTIKRHIDNLFVLGRYIIDHLTYHEQDRAIIPVLLLTHLIDSWEGPMIHDFSRDNQNYFDATCRKFYAFLVNNKLKTLKL